MALDRLNVGTRIKKARIDKKLTQAELAERLELSNNYISSIERGTSIPSLDCFIRVCNALDVTADMLLTDSVYKANEYLKESIAIKLEKCSKKNMRIAERFIDLLLEENE
ncbi:MAG: helix-turn-helix domain-containing protein [Oscillospiraceae bacterium]|jgi:transcriptional regulator with XRE-family HTH domain|nr:helix-turn-helix domain-containing protein [Oscillospiraceae bacterium]